MSALTNRRGRESTGLRKKPVAGCPPPKGSNLPILPRGEGGRGREGVHTYRVHTYLTKTRILEIATSDLYINKIAWTLKLNLKVNKKKTIYLIVPQQYDEVKNNFFLTPLKVMGSPPVRFS